MKKTPTPRNYDTAIQMLNSWVAAIAKQNERLFSSLFKRESIVINKENGFRLPSQNITVFSIDVKNIPTEKQILIKEALEKLKTGGVALQDNTIFLDITNPATGLAHNPNALEWLIYKTVGRNIRPNKPMKLGDLAFEKPYEKALEWLKKATNCPDSVHIGIIEHDLTQEQSPPTLTLHSKDAFPTFLDTMLHEIAKQGKIELKKLSFERSYTYRLVLNRVGDETIISPEELKEIIEKARLAQMVEHKGKGLGITGITFATNDFTLTTLPYDPNFEELTKHFKKWVGENGVTKIQNGITVYEFQKSPQEITHIIGHILDHMTIGAAVKSGIGSDPKKAGIEQFFVTTDNGIFFTFKQTESPNQKLFPSLQNVFGKNNVVIKPDNPNFIHVNIRNGQGLYSPSEIRKRLEGAITPLLAEEEERDATKRIKPTTALIPQRREAPSPYAHAINMIQHVAQQIGTAFEIQVTKIGTNATGIAPQTPLIAICILDESKKSEVFLAEIAKNLAFSTYDPKIKECHIILQGNEGEPLRPEILERVIRDAANAVGITIGTEKSSPQRR